MIRPTGDGMRVQVIVITTAFLLLITLPFLAAARLAGMEHVFGGFLLNPTDGNSYLAKMYQGWRGEWRFTLPYTAQPGRGAYLFLFYIFLGHLSRWLGISLIFTFHLARLVSALCMMLALAYFLKAAGAGAGGFALVFALALFGSGMGWLLFPFGVVASDFWVAETYPFLSAFSNPHFALGLALLLWLLVLGRRLQPGWLVALAAFLLSVISPFGVVLALCVLGGLLAWDVGVKLFHRHPFAVSEIFRLPAARRLAWVVIGGCPLLLYDAWVARSDPQLAAWDAQNLTLTPAVWDIVLSLSPVIVLALLGGWWVLRHNERPAMPLLVWSLLGLIFIYLPIGLQRRFMMGLFVPLVGLAGYALAFLFARFGKRAGKLAALVLLLSFFTNILLLLVAQHGVQTRDPLLYLTRGEAQAMEWIEIHTPPRALVLAAPQTGLFIPAHTGRRVLFGHPFETVNAQAEKQAVSQFFTSGDAARASMFLLARDVDYVFYGPRERQLGGLPELKHLQPVYSHNGVEIYQVVR